MKFPAQRQRHLGDVGPADIGCDAFLCQPHVIERDGHSDPPILRFHSCIIPRNSACMQARGTHLARFTQRIYHVRLAFFFRRNKFA